MRALDELTQQQAAGADPAVNAWVSASAGAGKTQLLAARMLRLMLAGAAPERLLALTFTKAAAAEMQARVFARLAHWAGADDALVDADLAALGAAEAPRARARALFGLALEARGGLQIRTIHAFAQSLLAAFPFEAGVDPDFAILDDRDAREGRRATLLALATAAEPGIMDDLGALAVRHGDLAAPVAILVAHAEAIAGLGDPATFEVRLRALAGVEGEGTMEAVLARRLAPGVFACAELRRFNAVLRDYATHHVRDGAEAIHAWLACDASGRCRDLDLLAAVFLTKEGTLRRQLVLKGAHALMADCEAVGGAIGTTIAELIALRDGLELARHAAAHLRVGHALARAAGRRAGAALSFDEVIARAADLLDRPGAADWVRFKLDQRVDHILVDEAQDTNADQWRIVRALADEFFAGDAGRGLRTVFAVGDHKQSIFGFQGADPAVFGAERRRLAERGVAVRDVELTRNYRSAAAVLGVVDAVLAQAGPVALGLDAAVPAHEAARTGAGAVTLWPPVSADADEGDDERGWIASAQRTMAGRLAAQIRAWLDAPLLLPDRDRPVRPQDILILVRKRREFVPVLVAALQERGVPVAGADRLRLTAAIAVRDVISLARFALQPGDDLALAELIVSPLLGWSQDELTELAHGRDGSLWAALRARADDRGRGAAAWLGEAIARADYEPPSRWLERLLSGPSGGRGRLLARLGPDARDPLGELVNAALAFERRHPPSLRGWLAWLDAGEEEIKRDPDAPRAEVRIMTVHAAKGLQAPVVVLADAAMPGEGRANPYVLMDVDGARVPVFHGGRSGKLGRVGEACAAATRADQEEEMRLLYVALTRAETLLFVGGALPKRARDGRAGERTWHAVIERALAALGAAPAPAALPWIGDERRHAPAAAPAVPEAVRADIGLGVDLVDHAWAFAAAPVERQPARPLTPSRIGADEAATPPGGDAGAARRGRLMHALFERLPTHPPATRAAEGRRWLALAAPEVSAAERDAWLADALGVIDDPAIAELFGPGTLAEAPLAAVVGLDVVAGKVDRLLVTAERVAVIDFKTGARVPATPPEPHLKQMAAYAAALARIFPGRRIEAGLVYTAGPRLVWLDRATLDQHAP